MKSGSLKSCSRNSNSFLTSLGNVPPVMDDFPIPISWGSEEKGFIILAKCLPESSVSSAAVSKSSKRTLQAITRRSKGTLNSVALDCKYRPREEEEEEEDDEEEGWVLVLSES